MAHNLRFARATIFMAVTLAAACSEDPVVGVDSGSPRPDATNDAGTTDASVDDASNDADASVDHAVSDTASEALSDGAATDSYDSDGTCTCTLVDSGLPAPLPANGVMSLPCYCAMPWPSIPNALPCGSYEDAIRCDGPRKDFGVTTYANCNLVTVTYGGGFTQDTRVYDYTTHELVGASRGTDHAILCITSQVFMVLSGIVPGPECQISKSVAPCLDPGPGDASAGDATKDIAADATAPDDADGGCTCEPDERNVGGHMSLACYCAVAGCPSYDTALTRCGSDAPPEVNRVEDYQDCNLVVITSGGSIPSGGSLVYDRTTHDLVGASFSADYPAFTCGDASVFGYRAGTFPPAGCAKSRSVPRCPRDGG